MYLRDTDGILFEIKAADIKDMTTRHGKRGDFTRILTHDGQLFNVEESVPYIMKIVNCEKENSHDQKG